MSTIKTYLADHWRALLMSLSVVLIVVLLLGWKLGSLTAGASRSELEVLASYASFHQILHNPLDLPYKLLGWALWHVPLHSIAWLRVPSAIFGVATLVMFSFIVRRWYGFRTALFGTALFVTCSWFLHASRLASFEIEYVWAITSLIGLHLLLHVYTENFIARLIWYIGMALLLFVPGFVWLVALNAIVQREDLAEVWETAASVDRVIFSCIAAIGAALLALTFVIHPHLVLSWIGAPASFADWQIMLRRFGDAFGYFIVRGPDNAALWLGRLPVLDAFASVMLAAGILFYGKHLSAPRTQLLGGTFIVGAVLFALNPTVRFSVLVPLVYLVATAGIAFILHQWLKVFPRNPLARGVGVAVVAVVTIAACGYNLRSYYVAWPQNPATHHTMTRILKPT
jgi:hypothetical protein